LTGQVRNLPDGSVEMIAQGQQQDIDDCIRDLQDSFMGGAIEVQTEDYPAGKSFTEFKITF
jgi:acylphosphatase